MSERAANLPTDSGSVGEQITCSKCGAANPKGGHRCVDCDAHLYVRCYHCRERNERGAVNCTACGETMQAPLGRRLKRTLKSENARLLVLVPSAILVLILAILWANYLMRAPEIVTNPRGNAPQLPASSKASADPDAISFPPSSK